MSGSIRLWHRQILRQLHSADSTCAALQLTSQACSICLAAALSLVLSLPPLSLADEIPDDLPFAPSQTVPATMEMKVSLHVLAAIKGFCKCLNALEMSFVTHTMMLVESFQYLLEGAAACFLHCFWLESPRHNLACNSHRLLIPETQTSRMRRNLQ